MHTWNEASSFETVHFEVISDFLSHRPQLIEFLFHPTQPRLMGDPEEIILESGGFCTSDQILIKLAIHLWSYHGSIKVHDLFYLDATVFTKVLNAIKALGPKTHEK